MENILIKNGKTLLVENNDFIIQKNDIYIQEGKIVEIAPQINKTETKLKIVDATNQIIMPGLINTHAHVPMSIFRETTEGIKLYDWLHEKIWPMEDKLTLEDVYWASMLSFVEMIATGTTCINDQYFMSEAIRRAAKDAKVRVVLTRTIMDADNCLEERIKDFKELYASKNQQDDLITYTVAPHGLYTCSEECLKQTATLAEELNLPVHIHYLESVDEIQDIQNQHGKPAIEVLKEHFSKVHLILAHGVKLNEKDIQGLKTMDCGIAHNPVSNLRLGCKIADVTNYLKQGLNVALRNRWTRLTVVTWICLKL